MSPRHILARPHSHTPVPYILRNGPASIVRARVYRVIHHPVTRILMFVSMVTISVYIADKIANSHIVTGGAIASAPYTVKGLQRLCEVLCDCVCDRLFPS